MSVSDIYRALGGGVVQPLTDRPGVSKPQTNKSGPSEFQSLLSNQVNLSQHAETRIRSRNIPWSVELEKRISQGIDAAEAKGSKETLILADNLAIIANVKSRTVVTAMERDQMKERIFTNIDSAVLV